MNVIFDARVLTHKHYTGVENYTQALLNQFQRTLNLKIAKPPFTHKYLAHIWLHVSLPFQKGELIFCPANTAPLFVPKSKKLVVTLHDIAFLSFSDSFSKFFQYYYQFLIPQVIKRADKIITISESSKKEILKYYPYAEGKIEIIALGVDEKYTVLPNTSKENIILYVGSLNQRKNFTSVIKAYQQLKQNGYKLMLVGNFVSHFTLDEESQSILNDAKHDPNIIFKSHVDTDELVSLYNRARVLVFPSFYEGFGLPPLEAMACGTPVITSNISSMPEVCGDAALFVDPYDVDDITSKMELLLNDPMLQEKMIQKGLLHVKQFSWERAAREHIKVFESVLKN